MEFLLEGRSNKIVSSSVSTSSIVGGDGSVVFVLVCTVHNNLLLMMILFTIFMNSIVCNAKKIFDSEKLLGKSIFFVGARCLSTGRLSNLRPPPGAPNHNQSHDDQASGPSLSHPSHRTVTVTGRLRVTAGPGYSLAG